MGDEPRLSWFPLYARDWLTDEAVTAMSLEQQGAYVRLLCHEWNGGSLPDSPPMLARLVAVPATDFEERIWPVLRDHFEAIGNAGRIRNRRLGVERAKSEHLYKVRSKAGKSGRRKQLQDAASTEPAGTARAEPGRGPAHSHSHTHSQEQKTELGGGDGLPGDLILSSHSKQSAAAPGSAPATLELIPDDSAARPPALSLPEGFAEMWERYGHKLGRDEALAAYRKLGLNPRHPTYGRVLEWIGRYQGTEGWRQGVRLRLSTALRKRRFEDEITTKPDWRVEFDKKKDWDQ